MKTGTKRMWVRRVLRFGDILAIAFKGPINGVKWALTDYNGRFAFINLFVCCVFSFMLFMVYNVVYGFYEQHASATPADIAAMLKDNPCMQDYLPRIVAETKEPVTLASLEAYDKQCKRSWADQDALKQQKKFLKIEEK